MYITHSDSTSSLKLISSTHSSLWLTTYLLCLVNPYFSTDSRYSYGDQLCSYSYRLVSVFVRGRLHAGTSQEKRKEASTLISPTAKQFSVPWFCDRIYPIEPEVKDTTDTAGFASCLILLFEIHSEDRLRTELYDKRDHFNFAFICSNIPAVPAYGVYIYRLIRYFRAFVSYNDFLNK